MLDDLLGRGFSSKVKSSVKVTKTRIEAVRKKRNASQKFLKKDIADLLAKGLDINAFGRAEGLVSELIISSCYDFVEHCCDTVLKNLSALQKRRGCTEECKVAVASLMFAAARFSDLPELRDLRQTFRGRYGNSFEFHINQKFVKNLSPNPATMEHKLQLLQDIARQNSIAWNAQAFEHRMSASLVTRPKESANYASLCATYDDDSKITSPCKSVSGNDRKENVNSRNEATRIKSFGNQLLTCSIKEEDVRVRRVEPIIPYSGAINIPNNLQAHNCEKPIVKSKPATGLLESYNGRLPSCARPSIMDTTKPDNQRELQGKDLDTIQSCNQRELQGKDLDDMHRSRYGEEQVLSSKRVTDFLEPRIHLKLAAADSIRSRDLCQEMKANPFSSKDEWCNGRENARPQEPSCDQLGSHSLGIILASQNDLNTVPASANYGECQKSLSSRKLQAEENARSKDFRPPPYVTIPRAKKNGINSKSKSDGIQEEDVGSQVIAEDQLKPKSGSTQDHPKYEKPVSDDVVKPLRANGCGARSELKIVGIHGEGFQYQVETSDRIETKFGQMPDHRWSQFDHPGHKKHVNEPGRAISHDQNETSSDHDNLAGIMLPKPRSSSDDSSHNEKLMKSSTGRRRRDARRGQQQTLIPAAAAAPTKDKEEKIIDNLLIHYSSRPTSFNSPEDTVSRTGERPVSTQFHPRSISLPRECSVPLQQPTKVFTRAASFQPNRPAQHVHPKLPDYDDLAARFSAMKSNF